MILQLKRHGFSDHHHHHHHNHRSRRMSEVKLAYLQAFQSLVSDNLNQALESLKLGSDFLSLTWIKQCFRMVPVISNAFAKLMVEIDYPVSSWESGSVDEYLDYSITLLELLNSISSSIARVNKARVSLTHGLSLMENSPALAMERMAQINVNSETQRKRQGFVKEFKCDEDGGNWNWNEEEWIFHEAMVVLKTTGFWVCGVVLSGLRSQIDPITKITENTVSMDSSLMALDSIFRKKFIEQRGIVKEIAGVNECVRLAISGGIGDSGGGMEMKRRLEVVGIGLIGLREEEKGVFGSVMAARNEVLEALRRNSN